MEPGPASCRALRQGDRVAERPPGVVAGEALGIEVVEVVAAQLAVRLAVAQDVVRDDEDAVGDRDDGLLVAALPDEPAVLRRSGAVDGALVRVGRHRCRTQDVPAGGYPDAHPDSQSDSRAPVRRMWQAG